MIAGSFRWMVRVVVALLNVLEVMLIEGDVPVLCIEGMTWVSILHLSLDLAAAIVAVGVPLRLFGLTLVGLRQVGVFIIALGSVIVFLQVGELFFGGIQLGIRELDFPRVDDFEMVLFLIGVCLEKGLSWDRTCAWTETMAMAMTKTCSGYMAMFIAVTIPAGNHEVLEHLEHHLESLIILIRRPLRLKILHHRLHWISLELAARRMI